MALFGGNKRWKRLEEAGVDTKAVLVSFREIGQQNFTPLVDMTFRITPDDGSAPFELAVRMQIDFSEIGKLKPGDVWSIRYDPADPSNHEIGDKIESADTGSAEKSLDSASAGEIAAAFQAAPATADTGQRRSAAELLASGQRMTAILREFAPSGKTVGDLDPSQSDPSDPVYVFKAELPIDGSTPIEAVFMNRVPQAKVASLRLGAHMSVAVNPANPSRELTIDWANSPMAT
jgi:hypothetical protein